MSRYFGVSFEGYKYGKNWTEEKKRSVDAIKPNTNFILP